MESSASEEEEEEEEEGEDPSHMRADFANTAFSISVSTGATWKKGRRDHACHVI
jgi:hypothetical protein